MDGLPGLELRFLGFATKTWTNEVLSVFLGQDLDCRRSARIDSVSFFWPRGQSAVEHLSMQDGRGRTTDFRTARADRNGTGVALLS